MSCLRILKLVADRSLFNIMDRFEEAWAEAGRRSRELLVDDAIPALQVV